MYTLGINAAFHDSAACLIRDGQILSAAEEERFTHIKHAKRPIPFSTYELPFNAVHYCLKHAGIKLSDIDHVAYSLDPHLYAMEWDSPESVSIPVRPAERNLYAWNQPWNQLFFTSVLNAPDHLRDGAPHHLARLFKGKPRFQWHYVDHHLAHAASAFFASPHLNAAVMCLDGRGELATTSYYRGNNVNGLQRISQVCMPHSLGLLYEKLTEYLGFLPSSDEYKVMALASYGHPVYLKEFRGLITLKGNGLYEIDQKPFEDICGPGREPGSKITQHHFDIAHSLQKVLEETVLELAGWLRDETREKSLCMAGGVALNCVMNARIRDAEIFENIWVQPASGDAGTALGAALQIDHLLRQPLNGHRPSIMKNAYLGPRFSNQEILAVLKRTHTPFREMKDIAEETADILKQDKIIGWFQGRMEFGPRALGSRSIVASPLKFSMQARLNNIKGREEFRPVAPIIPEENISEWFQEPEPSPFMLFVHKVKPGMNKKIPAACHVDGTARIQSVTASANPLWYGLIKAFGRKTGVPVLINTSFNTKSRPIVCTPEDALECFWTSPLDALVLGKYVVEKSA